MSAARKRTVRRGGARPATAATKPVAKTAAASAPVAGEFAYAGLDRVLHEKARLGILIALATRPSGLSFVDLKLACSLTDGNLARHLQTLEEGRLIASDKHRDGRRVQTWVRLTASGREQFDAYLGELERAVRDARTAEANAHPTDSRGGLAPA